MDLFDHQTIPLAAYLGASKLNYILAQLVIGNYG